MLLAITTWVSASRWVDAGGGLLRAQRLVGDPLLQPDHGGERAALDPELVEEAGDERRA